MTTTDDESGLAELDAMTTTADERCTSRQLDPVFRCTLPAGHAQLHRNGLKQWGDDPLPAPPWSVRDLENEVVGDHGTTTERDRLVKMLKATAAQRDAADRINGELSRQLAEAERRATAFSDQLEDCRDGRDQLRDELEQVEAERDQMNRTSVLVRRDFGDALRELDELRDELEQVKAERDDAERNPLLRIADALEQIAEHTKPLPPLRMVPPGGIVSGTPNTLPHTRLLG